MTGILLFTLLHNSMFYNNLYWYECIIAKINLVNTHVLIIHSNCMCVPSAGLSLISAISEPFFPLFYSAPQNRLHSQVNILYLPTHLVNKTLLSHNNHVVMVVGVLRRSA